MVRKSFAEKKQKKREKKIRLKQYISLRSKWRHNYLWQPYLLMDRDEVSNLYRGPPIYASYQVLVHIWQSGFRGEYFLDINQSETRIVCGSHVC